MLTRTLSGLVGRCFERVRLWVSGFGFKVSGSYITPIYLQLQSDGFYSTQTHCGFLEV